MSVGKDTKQRVPPPDHCGILHPNAGRRPCTKKEKTPCTSTPSQPGDDKIKRHPMEKETVLSSLHRPYLQLHCQGFDWFCPPLIPRRRWAESMRRAVYQWRRLTLRFYSSRVFPRLVLIRAGSGLSDNYRSSPGGLYRGNSEQSAVCLQR